MMTTINHRAVGHLIALWMRERTPLEAAAGLYRQVSDPSTERPQDYQAAAEEIIRCCGDSLACDLIDSTLAQLDAVEAGRRAMRKLEPAA